MFDKAEEAEQLEFAREALRIELKQLELDSEKASREERKTIRAQIETKKVQLDKLMNKVPANTEH